MRVAGDGEVSARARPLQCLLEDLHVGAERVPPVVDQRVVEIDLRPPGRETTNVDDGQPQSAEGVPLLELVEPSHQYDPHHDRNRGGGVGEPVVDRELGSREGE